MNSLRIAAFFAICIIPVAAVFVIEKLFVKGFKSASGLYAVLLGLLCIAPTLLIQTAFERLNLFRADTLSSLLGRILLENGLTEEAVKMGALFLISTKNKDLKVFFTLAVLVGLSFGAFETLVYLVLGTQSFTLRLFTAVLLHATLCALSSLFVFSAKKGRFRISGFFWAVILHTLYNYFAGFKMESAFFWISIPVVVLALVVCAVKFRSMITESAAEPAPPQLDSSEQK